MGFEVVLLRNRLFCGHVHSKTRRALAVQQGQAVLTCGLYSRRCPLSTVEPESGVAASVTRQLNARAGSADREAADVDAPEPRLLRGRYRVSELLGRGGGGSVYRAHDEFLARDVAVKIFPASTDESETRRQEAEVNVLASLNHHGLVTLLDAAIDRDEFDSPRIYFVMALVEGEDLRQRISREPLTPREVAHIGYDLAEGLQYIHHLGVVHRDIKPANIMMVDYQNDSTRPRAKLTDFGIALRTDDERSTSTGLTAGTAAYLSPEQVRQTPVGPPSDVYSLGLVLLECFTREIAFPGDPVPSAVARVLGEPHLPEDLPEDWRILLAAMTAQNPDDRPDANDLVLALSQAMISETGRHRHDLPLIPANEPQRLEAIRRYDLVNAPQNGSFDRITAIAARVFSVPIAIVSVVDHDRIWFSSHHGLEIEEVGRDAGLCASAILQDEPWVVEDARIDPRALANPLVAGEFGLQFYAGVPLRTHDGFQLGTLCVLDVSPRRATAAELATLTDLAALVMNELELRLAVRDIERVSATPTAEMSVIA
ncbi:protein kinase [Lacisediminihabitans profunda]|uniref:non-specific serine/threonine protein kinase n=1 Tax=Lacisediminihabitans profunda TaxID=2594790 RepID=A0A5C8UKY6_9MICO|nr:protein kinase [Lacisediminihabitans profunda]